MLEIVLGWKGKSTQHVNNYEILKLKVKNIFYVILFKKLIVWKSVNTKWAKPKYKILKLFCWLDFLGCSFLCIFCKRSICINLFVFGWYVGKLAIVQWVDKKSGLKDCLQLFLKANCHVE